MARKRTKPRPKQGQHLAQLRKNAGLSQQELADMVGVKQGTITYWEVTDKHPRSEVIEKMAEILNVNIEDILNIRKNVKKPSSGPTGKARRIFETVSSLPPRQQEKFDVVSAMINQYNTKT